MKFGYLENVDDIDFSLPEDNQWTKELLSDLSPAGLPEIYIGCPVWGDKGYAGTMYPKRTRPKDFLAAYCKQFNCVEVNATRYGIPPQTTLEAWKNIAGEGFKFSFKMPQVITHRRNMNDNDARNRLDQFLLALDFFGNKAGTTFMLLPPYFNLSKLEELKMFINNFPHDLPLAIEVRDAGFYNHPEVYQLLKKRNIPLVITDTPGRRDLVHQVLTTDAVFVRFVGATLHPSDYLRIDQWVHKITGWVNEGVKTVYFYMHQPAPYKYLSGPLAAYMIEKLNGSISGINLKVPVDYSTDGQLMMPEG